METPFNEVCNLITERHVGNHRAIVVGVIHF
jgi:hypothetical protein